MNSNFDMKKIVLGLFGVMIISFLIAGSIISVKGLGGSFIKSPASADKQDINVEKVFNADDIKDMELSTSSTNINVIPVDAKEVKVHYYGYSSRPVPEIEIDLRGSKLVVREKHKVNISIGFNFIGHSMKLDVYVPKSYAGNIDIGTSSGDANVENMTLEGFKFSSSSGNLHSSGLSAKNSELSTSSGDLTVKGFSGSLKFHSSSGNLNASDVDLKGNLSADSSSGEIRLDCIGFNGNIKTNTSSGDIKISLPENAEFSVDYNTSLGDFETNFPTVTNQKNRHSVRATVGNSQHSITSSSSSGNLRIMKR